MNFRIEIDDNGVSASDEVLYRMTRILSQWHSCVEPGCRTKWSLFPTGRCSDASPCSRLLRYTVQVGQARWAQDVTDTFATGLVGRSWRFLKQCKTLWRKGNCPACSRLKREVMQCSTFHRGRKQRAFTRRKAKLMYTTTGISSP